MGTRSTRDSDSHALEKERVRLLELVHVLKGVFPEDEGGLGVMEGRLRGRRKGKARGGSDADDEEEENVLRGRDPVHVHEHEHGRVDPLIHVFVDHSNILVGLLTYLKRRALRRKDGGSGIANRRPPKPRPPSLVVDVGRDKEEVMDSVVRPSTTEKVKERKRSTLPGKTLRARALPLVQTHPGSVADYGSAAHTGMTPIPLPSFATAGRALKAGGGGVVSPRSANGGEPVYGKSSSQSQSQSKDRSPRSRSLVVGSLGSGSGSGDSGEGYEREHDDGDNDGGEREASNDDGGEDEGELKSKKQQARRLSHTALTLILERGRPITRRVLVTSSPLYQPMDTMERLGYEVRVYMRVPDLGDGMDRDRHHHKHKDSPGDNPKGSKTHARRVSGSTSTESASASASTSAGEAVKESVRNYHHHPLSATVPRSSISIPFPEGSNTSIPSPASNNTPIHPLLRAVDNSYNATTPTSPGRRIRYREQGVDELLQLKLHQALAATDDVPEGATIVLATGDGNVGQFSEDGFLGPVRTALRRGWKVELYAWEEGLSRAWRREFGEGSEWGRSGMFRIVGMEQFAESLVEGRL